MSENTINLELYKIDTTTDGDNSFNIDTVLNDNWDKIDAFAASKGEPEGIAPLDSNGLVPDEYLPSFRNIGEIVTSTIPLADAGLHLCDGALISSGSYASFIDYIAEVSVTNPDLFCTEAAWQQSILDYGVCGKYVYDSTNNTVRLPKIQGFIEGGTEASVGGLVEAGLPNITGNVGTVSDLLGSPTGSFVSTRSTGYGTPTVNYNSINTNFDASRSSSVYGNSTTVQPQAIKVLYYVVVATSSKTSIQVDIDEIATDLNGKADKDGTNMINELSAGAKEYFTGLYMPDYTTGINKAVNVEHTAEDNLYCIPYAQINGGGVSLTVDNILVWTFSSNGSSTPNITSSCGVILPKGSKYKLSYGNYVMSARLTVYKLKGAQ